MTATNILLAVDGNSLLHRSFHALASSNLSTKDGRPTWAVKGCVSQILGAVELAEASAVVVGFDDHTHSVRKVAHPHYKATRSPKPPELGQQIQLTIDLLRAAGIHVVSPAGLEADDVLASASAYAQRVGWNTVIVTSDRDSFALIDAHTHVLRVINGGIEASQMLNGERLHTMYGIRPDQYQQYAAMRGDPSDNLAGIHGIGEKGAAKLLKEFTSVADAFADADADGARVARSAGRAAIAKLKNPDSRAAFWRNMEIMAMHRDIELGLDLPNPTGAGRLPLDPARVAAALDSLELFSLRGYCARVLCGAGEPSVTTAVPQPPAGFDDIPPAMDEGLWVGDTYPPAPESTRHTDGPTEEPPVPTRPAARALASAGAMRGSTAPRPASLDDTIW